MIEEIQSGDQQKQNDNPQTADPEAIFDERLRLFTEHFQDICKKENVPVAILAVVDPKIQMGPICFTLGDDYESAQLTAFLLRRLKQQVMKTMEA